ncbi:hypothetical protein ABT158_31505 [Nonomuraea sp. NPDC001636]|uniref:hypothetical protein n=1 Tax=Nonomuraea sp. NPDC001636 TaxID=3154391 RepID=UPI00331A37E5
MANSQAALNRVFRGDELQDEPAALAGWIDEEADRVVVETNTFDQDLRHRLAERHKLPHHAPTVVFDDMRA